ncbi:tetratricopeptide repeat protein, partial [Francisella orientalis]
MSLRRLIFALLLLPCFCFSNKWNDLWQTRDQQGMNYYDSGNAKKAAEAFENSNWKGSSYYKAGDYQNAYQEFKKDDSAKGLYNQGNALTHMGEYKKAIDAYTKAIQKRPDFADAKNNLEVAKELDKQKDNQQNSQDNKDN